MDWNCALRFHRPRLSGVGESSAAARAVAVISADERREGGRLRECHDGLERQRRAVGVVAVGDAADGVPEDLHRRLGHVLVVVRRARLAEVLELPQFLRTRLGVGPGLDARQRTERLKAAFGRAPPPRKTGTSGRGLSGITLLMWAWTTRFIGR